MYRVSAYLAALLSDLTTTRRSVFAGGAWLARPITAHIAAPGAVCGRCRRESGAVCLLTSASIYYDCEHCHHRWSEPAPTRASHDVSSQL